MPGNDEEKKQVLFSKKDGKVLSENFQFWYAANFKPAEMDKARMAVDYVRNSYITRDGDEFLTLDAAEELIKKLTGVTVKIK